MRWVGHFLEALLRIFPIIRHPQVACGIDHDVGDGGLQIITDVAIDPAGNVWVANNWDRPDEGFKKVPDPALATRFGGNGTVVFFGLAKPVRTPLIGPPRQP